jgi:predicted ATP-dependent Lon-type protease
MSSPSSFGLLMRQSLVRSLAWRHWLPCARRCLKRSVRGGLIIVGEINLGGSIEPVHNAVTIAEIAVEKGATSLLMPVACRRQLVDLSDDMATKIDIQFYSDCPRCAVEGHGRVTKRKKQHGA